MLVIHSKHIQHPYRYALFESFIISQFLILEVSKEFVCDLIMRIFPLYIMIIVRAAILWIIC